MFCPRLREPVSVMVGKVRTHLLHPHELTSSQTQSTCRSLVGAALILWVCHQVYREEAAAGYAACVLPLFFNLCNNDRRFTICVKSVLKLINTYRCIKNYVLRKSTLVRHFHCIRCLFFCFFN